MSSRPDAFSRSGAIRNWIAYRGHLLALAVLIGSMALVLIAWRYTYQRELSAAESDFVSRANETAEHFTQRMNQYELVIRGGASLFASVNRPTPRQWQAYVDQLQIDKRFPGMAGLGFATYLRHSRLDELQVEWRDSGYGLFEVWPRGVRSEYGPVLYLEPKTIENRAVIGYDMYSEPVRKQAMVAALDTGAAHLSGPVRLVQDRGTPAIGMMLCVAVYRGADRPATQTGRSEAMQGWVYVPLRVERFVRVAMGGTHEHELSFRIHDVTDGHREFLFESDSKAATAAFQHKVEIEQYGRRWEVVFDSAPLAQAVPGLQALRNTLALGVFTSLLMYAFAWTLAHTQSRAEIIAARMTEDLKRSELRFRTAIQHSAIGEALLDGDGRIVEANAAFGAIVGHRRERLHGSALDDLFYPAMRSGMVSRDGIRRETRRPKREDGEAREAHLTYAPFPGDVGDNITGLVHVEDITERIRAEAQVRALNRTLEARVALRTRALLHANQELEAFAYSVSHDLRAPLRAIDGFSRILMERYGGKLDESGQDYLERVRKAAGRMGELIDALLKMSRLSRTELRREPLDFSRMAIEVIDELRAADRDRDVDVTIVPDLHVQGDAALVRNLLVNLLGNAWKFTQAREDARIELGAGASEEGLTEYFIRDNGAGFAQDYADKLFRPFQRLHGQDEFAGHGIGLASVRRIIERHGGEIRAEGRVGEGATFYFTLPDEEEDS